MPGPKETAYDEHISPLMTKIIAMTASTPEGWPPGRYELATYTLVDHRTLGWDHKAQKQTYETYEEYSWCVPKVEGDGMLKSVEAAMEQAHAHYRTTREYDLEHQLAAADDKFMTQLHEACYSACTCDDMSCPACKVAHFMAPDEEWRNVQR